MGFKSDFIQVEVRQHGVGVGFRTSLADKYDIYACVGGMCRAYPGDEETFLHGRSRGVLTVASRPFKGGIPSIRGMVPECLRRDLRRTGHFVWWCFEFIEEG